MSPQRPRDGEATDDKRALWYLRKIPLFAGIEPERLNQLLAAIEVREIKRRRVIYMPGDPGDRVFFIMGGRVKRAKVTRDGKELTLAYLGAGEVFGDLCVIDRTPREELAEAMKNTILAELPIEVLCELLLTDARLAIAFASIQVARRRQIEAKIEHLVFRDVQTKLAALLLELGEEYGVASDGGTQIGLKITHQELASLIGSTRETVSLALAQFRKMGALELVGRSILLKDHEALRAMS